jgi:hypothetical protein
MAVKKTSGSRRKAPRPSARRTSARGRRIATAAIAHGRRQAREVIKRRGTRGVVRASAASPGVLIAEGDSWFDYPFFDVLERLEDKFDYRVESVAHKGDTLEEMAYDPTQLNKLARLFERVKADRRKPRAILLSGGGNDIAGEELGVLLNHAEARLGDVNENVVTGIIDERLRFAMTSIVSAVTALAEQHFARTVPILLHGYGYPVPDGRGYASGFWILPGPWLEPGFRQKGYVDASMKKVDLPRCTAIMRKLIDRFNQMMAGIAATPGFSHVHYVDMRSILSSAVPGYKTDWNDELHPTKSGFETVAQKFHDKILTFPMPV